MKAYNYFINERNTLIKIIDVTKDQAGIIEPNFQFWVDDDIVCLNDILVEKRVIAKNHFELLLEGSQIQIESYLRNIRLNIKKTDISFQLISDKTEKIKSYKDYDYNLEVIEKVKLLLPEQPCPKGIHKEIASKLNLNNKIIQRIINLLIQRGDYYPQENGKIITKIN